MDRTRPVAGAVLTFIGGIFLLFGALVQFVTLAVLALLFDWIHIPHPLLYLGFLISVLVVLMAILMWVVPSGRIAWGALTILLAVFSLLFTTLGGFLIGFVLCLIGGILAIVGSRRRSIRIIEIPNPPQI